MVLCPFCSLCERRCTGQTHSVGQTPGLLSKPLKQPEISVMVSIHQQPLISKALVFRSESLIRSTGKDLSEFLLAWTILSIILSH